MTNFVYANNVSTTLAAAAISTATTITLASATNLPMLPIGYVLALTLNDAATRMVYEIVYVTAITGTTLTVMRAQEGTTAQNWNIGDYAFSTVTAGQELKARPFFTLAMATALVVAQTGALVELTGTTAFTTTLPSPVGNTGARYKFFANGFAQTLATPAAYFEGPNGGGLATLMLPNGATVDVESDGSNWIVSNLTFGAASSMLTSTGYTKLTNGLIIQWGTFDATTGGTEVTYPIAFPNACLGGVAGTMNGSATYYISTSTLPGTTTYFTAWSSAGTVGGSYIVVGH